MQPIEKLRQSVHGWLVEYELDGDTAFFTQAEWRGRGEAYLLDSCLILVFEGEFYRVMNGGHEESIALYDEFERFLRGIGYYFELGHAWSMGFYLLPARQQHSDLRIYSEQP